MSLAEQHPWRTTHVVYRRTEAAARRRYLAEWRERVNLAANAGDTLDPPFAIAFNPDTDL